MSGRVHGRVSPERSRIMRAIRSESREEKEWRLLLGFRKGAVLGIRVDAVDRGKRVAYFYDSCFWHGCPVHFKLPSTRRAWWRRKIDANRARDLRQTELLQEAGWDVVRMWGHEMEGLRRRKGAVA